ncbi:hypothetical protein THUN1379_28460 [Paludibacterium sp. THUN1379]|nr:hypothetical protein THUN1379_28460 [Paludibacterium sp. THUN1379]
MTLIELLVAMSLMAILSVLGYQGFSALLIARERLLSVSAQWVDLARVFARVGHDLDRLPPLDGADPRPRLLLQGEPTNQVLSVWLPGTPSPGSLDQVRYRAGQEGLAWSSSRADGQFFPLLSSGARVQWRLQLDDGRWVEQWHGASANRPRLLEMQVRDRALGSVTRFWRLP